MLQDYGNSYFKVIMITTFFFFLTFGFSYSSCEDLAVYVQALKDCLPRIPPNTFSKVKKNHPISTTSRASVIKQNYANLYLHLCVDTWND